MENLVVEKMIKGDKVLFESKYRYMALEQNIREFWVVFRQSRLTVAQITYLSTFLCVCNLMFKPFKLKIVFGFLG